MKVAHAFTTAALLLAVGCAGPGSRGPAPSSPYPVATRSAQTSTPAPASRPAPLAPAVAGQIRDAAAAGDVAALERLELSGVDPDAPLDLEGGRALAVAALSDRPRAVEHLLGRGASPNAGVAGAALASAGGGIGPVALVTLLARRGASESMELLLRYGAVVSPLSGPAPLREAVARCDARMIELLVRFGAPVEPGFTAKARSLRCPASLVAVLEANDPDGGGAFDAQWARFGAIAREGTAALARNDGSTARRLFEEGAAVVARVPGMHRNLARAFRLLGDEPMAAAQVARYLELAQQLEQAPSARRDLRQSGYAAQVASARVPPPWEVRWRCDGSEVAECRAQCDHENGGSCVELARLVDRGAAGPQDPGTALILLDRACDLGSPDGCYWAGRARYREEMGSRKDLATAERLARRGCTVGNGVSCNLVGAIIVERGMTVKNAALAAPFFARGCAWGDAKSCSSLGAFLYEALGVPLDVERGLALATRGCDENVGAACEQLAKMYEEDRGVPPDRVRAATCRAKACAAGVKSACR